MQFVLSEKTKEQKLQDIKECLGKDEQYIKQLPKFKAGKIKATVIAAQARWTLIESSNKERIAHTYLVDYMKYGKPDAEKYAYSTTWGKLKMEEEEMILEIPDIGHETKTFYDETIRLESFDLLEDTIDLILGNVMMI